MAEKQQHRNIPSHRRSVVGLDDAHADRSVRHNQIRIKIRQNGNSRVAPPESAIIFLKLRFHELKTVL